MEVLAVCAALMLAVVFASMAVGAGWISVPDQDLRLGYMDGLRGYLAISVAVHHFAIWLNVIDGGPWIGPSSHVLSNAGLSGVAIFFMISGALFYERVSRENDRLDWLRLYMSRAFRIVPLMWAVVLVIVAITLMRSGDLAQFELKALAKWLLFESMPDLFGVEDTKRIIAGVAWSLRVEWVFYVSLPLIALILWLAKTVKIPYWLLLVMGTAAGCTLFGKYWLVELGVIPFFGIGMIAIEVRRAGWLTKWIEKAGLWVAVVGLLALAAQFVMTPGSFNTESVILLAVFFIPVVCGCDYFKLLRLKGSLALGETSYGIYLLHGIVLSLSFTELGLGELVDGPSRWLLFVPLLLVIVAVSIVSYITIERPMIDKGKQLAGRVPRRRIAG